jgi:hypothetical protein
MAWVQDNTTPSGVAWVDDAVQYSPMQSLSANLGGFGSLGGLENAFIGPIQTAFATQAGRQDYGGQDAWKLITDNWDQLSKIVSSSTDPFNDVFRFANSVLQNAGMGPYSSVDEWSTANRSIPGHNESFSPFNPVDIISGVADVGGELLDEPGFQALLAAGGAGALMGPPSVGSGLTGSGLAEVAPFGGFDASAVAGTDYGLGEILGGGALGGAGLGLGGVLGGVGDLLGGLKDYLPSGNTAAALAPIIAAIAYAKNQGPFDTSRLTSTYDQFEPDALAYEYDQNTNAGRNALTSSLTNRGVMGSSFGNMDLTNFQTTRDLGRRSLVNQGLAARGGLASSILDAQVKERQLKNQLYGTSLLALGNVFGGRNQPTGGIP